MPRGLVCCSGVRPLREDGQDGEHPPTNDDLRAVGVEWRGDVRGMRTTSIGMRAKGNECPARSDDLRATAIVPDGGTADTGPNKPMVPTAPTSLTHYPPGSLRRHIGQPFDSGAATSSVKALGFSLDTQKSKTRTTDAGTSFE